MTDKILKFQAAWCAPCKALSMQLRGVDLGVPVEEIDIDASKDMVAKYGVRSIPTLVYVRGDAEVSRHVGFIAVPKLQAWVDQLKGPQPLR
jgi:thioredoxin 2